MSLRVQNWLEHARYSPSGGNRQAWKVRAEDLGSIVHIEVSAPDVEPLLTDPLDGGLLIGVGCLAKTLEVVAASEGFTLVQTHYHLSPKSRENRVLLSFEQRESVKPLIPVNAVYERRTFRGPMNSLALPDELHRAILESASDEVGVTSLTQEKKYFAELFCRFEVWRCTKKELFKELISEIIFPGEKSKYGIPLGVLGISIFGQLWMQLCRWFPFLQVFFRLGMKFVYQQEGIVKPLRHSAGFYILRSRDHRPIGWYHLGWHLQDTWLKVQTQGGVLQPFIGLSLQAHGVLNGALLSYLETDEKESLVSANEDLKKEQGIDLGTPQVFFRVGRSSRSVAVSPRASLQAEIGHNLLQEYLP